MFTSVFSVQTIKDFYTVGFTTITCRLYICLVSLGWVRLGRAKWGQVGAGSGQVGLSGVRLGWVRSARAEWGQVGLGQVS